VKAIRPQPRPNAKRTDPVTTGSEPPEARLNRRAAAMAAPARSEPKIARTGERLLVLCAESFMRSAPRMRASGLPAVMDLIAMSVPPERLSHDASEWIVGSPCLVGP
jgi:hypothetical protein